MVERYKRSRSFRKLQVKTPGGRTADTLKAQKPKLGRCNVTGQTLKGVPRAKAHDLKKLSKTQRRPERPFGGVLSSKAMRDVFKARARQTE